MNEQPLRCPCAGTQFTKLFTYHTRPEGETGFRFNAHERYYREVLRCVTCGHMLSVHQLAEGALYAGDYVESTYGATGLRGAYERIIALPPDCSDNTGRVRRLLRFAADHWGARQEARPTVLDVGSGLCVFLHGMKAAGWDCTALDPDPRAATHAREVVGVRSVCADFFTAGNLGVFDVVTLNKVLEHVRDTVAMLARARRHCHPAGFVYLEVPDGEMAAADGPGREEFFIEHHHVFSAASLALLALRAGFAVRVLERLREPSTKYTLRAFLTPAPAHVAQAA
jgi:2-polyprenyl-3-methyl-5-hydroxy-6-metoxy-1,4-benzoquinol methylase